MNLFQYNKILYKGNVERDFYFFCVKRNYKLLRFLFLNFFNYIISIFFTKYQNFYKKKKYQYLKYVNDLDEKVAEFYSIKNRYNDLLTSTKIRNKDLIVEELPNILFDKNLSNKIIGYELDEQYNVDIEKFNSNIKKIKKVNNLFIRNMQELSGVDAKEYILVNKKRLIVYKNRKTISKKLYNFMYVFITSFLLTCISFFYTSAVLNLDMLKSYFYPQLFLLNFLPLLFLISLLFLIFKKLHISFAITSITILGLGIANQTKLMYRDDIVKFIDLTLLKEAASMAERYKIVIKRYTIIFIIFLFIMYFFLKKKQIKCKKSFLKRFLLIILIIVLSFVGYKNVYCNKEIYDKLGNKTLINVWLETRQYQIRGLVYPFIYTINDGFSVEPEGYDEVQAKKILEKYQYNNIDDNKKVNIIAIMLEAYNDFSKFEKIDFTEDIYKNFHEIQKKSISGTLITSIFGGGTIVTERNFLTGYLLEPNYRKNTNSYVWYFKEQGYRTEAMHPVYGAFYNRASVNPNLGFDKYYHYDNTYSSIQTEYLNDNDFFDYIISGFKEAKTDNVPYFNFSVTYQNHGPYSDTEFKEPYFENKGYSATAYNTLNWYFDGIKKTDEALGKLINYFDKEDEPTIIIFFGDHNPYLGEGALAYNEIGIDLNLNTEKGFVNYYGTPYVIHANESAKQVYNKSFSGKGHTISPVFLMNELFDYCNLKGNKYLQYMNDLKAKLDVINKEYYKENNTFVHISDSEYKNLIKEYEFVNYYYSRNYKDWSK